MEKLIFDFDGTLVDSMEQWAGKMINVLKTNSVKYPENIISIITPLGDRATAEYFVDVLGIKLTVEEIIKEMDSFAIKEYTYNIMAKNTVVDTLKELKNRGYSLNVLTASPHRMLDVCLKRNGIYDIFDNVWSCDDFFTTKSDVNIYNMVAEKLDTTVENCIFFDDNKNALATAKEAGMKIIGVYDKSSDEYKDEIIALSDKYIYKLSEFIE